MKTTDSDAARRATGGVGTTSERATGGYQNASTLHRLVNRPSADLARDLFARHLDLRPLKGRARGLVRCRFHADTTPSLSIDLDIGLFHCFACGAQGGIKRFAELVGEPLVPRPTPRLAPKPRSLLDEARADALRHAQEQQRRLAPFRDAFVVAAEIRRRYRVVDAARAAAHAVGDTPAAWRVLAEANALDRQTRVLEAEI